MIFIIDIFQFHCKSEQKHVKWNKIKGGMGKSDCTLPYLRSSTLFKALLIRELIYTYLLNLWRKTLKKKQSNCRWEKISTATEENI